MLKLTAGYAGRSQAVVADGVHSLSDTATDLIILVGVGFWSAPPDADHPHGHRRIETVVTSFIGILLVGVAIGLIVDALAAISGRSVEKPDWIALAAALVSIVSKEILYRYTVRAGKEIKSAAVVANAWHQRSDMLSSIPAAIAVLTARLIPGWGFVDRIGALVVSIFILKAAWDIILPSLKQLIDTGASPEDCEKIKTIALESDGVRSVHALRTRYSGSALIVDLHILVDADITVQQGHDISAAVRRAIIEKGPDVLDVIVHIEPDDGHVSGLHRMGSIDDETGDENC